MASVVYKKNANGSVYAYKSESYWCKEKKAPRTKRTYLGKVDPETGEIIRVYHKPGQDPASENDGSESAPLYSEDYAKAIAELESLRDENQKLKEQVAFLTGAISTLKETINAL